MVFSRGFLRVVSKLFFKTVKLFLILLGISLVGILFLSLRLALGPIDITFLKTFVNISTFQKPLITDVNRIFLKYNGASDPLTLLMEEVTFFKDHTPLLKIPKITIHADYGALLKGDLKLRSVSFLEPEFSVSLESEKAIQIKDVKENPDAFLILGLLTNFVKEQNIAPEGEALKFQKVIQNLEEISIENGKLHLTQKEEGATLETTLNMFLTRQNGQDFSLKFRIELNNAKICLPKLDKRTFFIPNLSILGTSKQNGHVLEFSIPTFNWQGIDVKGHGKGQILPNGKIEIESNFEVEPLPLSQFSAVWPENLAESTRSWILQNLSKGDIDHIIVHLKAETSSFYEKERNFFCKVTKVEGGFNINKIDVQYIEGLPAATDVSGIVKFNNDDFNIEILKGEVEGIQVTKGRIYFYDLSQDDELAEINLTLKGKLQRILEVIDKKPLQYPTQLGILPRDFQGMATVNLLLKFPLLRHLTLDEIDVSTKSFLEKVSYTHLFEQRKNGTSLKRSLKIENGFFNLDVDKLNLILNGYGDLKKIKTHILWNEYFKNQQQGLSRKLSLKGDYPLSFFEEFGIFLNKYMRGTLGLDFSMTEKKGGASEIDVKADLKNIDIKVPELNIHKKIKEPGILSFTGKLPSAHKKDEKRPCVFSNIYLQGPRLLIEGNAILNLQTQEVIKIDLSTVKTPRNNFMILMDKSFQNLYHVKIRGQEMDMSWIFKDQDRPSQTDVASEATESKDTFLDLSLDLILDRLWLNRDEFVKSLSFDLKRINNRIEKAISKGKLKEGSFFDFAYEHVKGSPGHSLHLQTSNAGEFLRAIDFYDHIEGGKLHITAKKSSPHVDSFLEGKALLEDFRILKTPVVAKVLSLASLEWMSDALNQKKGMLFRNASLDFKINDHKLEILHGLAENSSTGVTLKGEMDRIKKTLNFHGTIIPAYMFNSLIGKIPFIGDILSGGSGKGFLAISYEVKGIADHPEVHVNPFSILTPGFIRELF
ncbi:MAG: AsmA-like C-terminal domain-containing protein [Proteobacteria bacterium]|nr:AsmA-like C-terminal domain-containing protein [Pseudomonadota bacterium]